MLERRKQLGNFNSHAHVERDGFGSLTLDLHEISTHTLTWSVTTVRTAMGAVMTISTHTLTWSVTLLSNIAGSAS